LIAQHPELATQLREMVTALVMLHQLGHVSEPAGDTGSFSLGAEPIVGHLGDFQILREIGRGGMGVVYEAVQISLGRRVALKVLPFAAALDARQLQRFKNEAQAAAHLHHTNIVPVFGVGCERGVHYYAMQYIEGQTLAAVIAELRQQAGLEKRDPSHPLSEVVNELIAGRLAAPKRAVSAGPPTTPYVPNYRAAFDLAVIAQRVIADDPTLAQLRPEFASFWTVTTDPPGADCSLDPGPHRHGADEHGGHACLMPATGRSAAGSWRHSAGRRSLEPMSKASERRTLVP
jgi:hypothetical protein